LLQSDPVGFFARPTSNGDGSSNIFKWEPGIPGKKGTDWEGGLYKVRIDFCQVYPSKAPVVTFTPVIFHPNVYPCGRVCLSILTSAWRPAISFKEVLMGVQDLLNAPNENSPANGQANAIFRRNKSEYKKRVQVETRKHTPLEVL
jgi:ubiquitin-conjugating enzyme E2 I